MTTNDQLPVAPEPDVDGDVRYPDIEVTLSGTDGNAGAILGAVSRALRRAHVPSDEIDLWRKEAMSGDYDHLLQTAMRWVDVS